MGSFICVSNVTFGWIKFNIWRLTKHKDTEHRGIPKLFILVTYKKMIWISAKKYLNFISPNMKFYSCNKCEYQTKIIGHLTIHKAYKHRYVTLTSIINIIKHLFHLKNRIYVSCSTYTFSMLTLIVVFQPRFQTAKLSTEVTRICAASLIKG